jgi:hypothetical protein
MNLKLSEPLKQKIKALSFDNLMESRHEFLSYAYFVDCPDVPDGFPKEHPWVAEPTHPIAVGPVHVILPFLRTIWVDSRSSTIFSALIGVW